MNPPLAEQNFRKHNSFNTILVLHWLLQPIQMPGQQFKIHMVISTTSCLQVASTAKTIHTIHSRAKLTDIKIHTTYKVDTATTVQHKNRSIKTSSKIQRKSPAFNLSGLDDVPIDIYSPKIYRNQICKTHEQKLGIWTISETKHAIQKQNSYQQTQNPPRNPVSLPPNARSTAKEP